MMFSLINDTGAEVRKNARRLWGNSVKSDSTRQVPENPGSRDPSPTGATTTSDDDKDPEEVIIPHLDHTIQLPTVQLPCRILGPDLGKCFGRTEDLERLEAELLPPVSAQGSLNRPQVLRRFAISGHGGTGKTHIAQEFVARNQHNFDAVFWINAETESKLATSVNTAAAELGLLDEADFGNSVVSRNRLVEWLSWPRQGHHDQSGLNRNTESPGSERLAEWLVVFDNANDMDMLIDYWPGPMTESGSILLTSRDPLSSWTGCGIELDGFDDATGANFMQQSLLAEKGQRISLEDASRLSRRLGGLPFTLLRAIEVLHDQNLTTDEFLDFLEEHKFLAEIYGSGQGHGSPTGDQGLPDVWAFETLREVRPRAMSLLETLALSE